jgi:hypothetical protein
MGKAAGDPNLRIKIVRRPTETGVDGISFDRFELGHHYEVGSLLGALMLAERWAEPAEDDDQPDSAQKSPW